MSSEGGAKEGDAKEGGAKEGDETYMLVFSAKSEKLNLFKRQMIGSKWYSPTIYSQLFTFQTIEGKWSKRPILYTCVFSDTKWNRDNWRSNYVWPDAYVVAEGVPSEALSAFSRRIYHA